MQRPCRSGMNDACAQDSGLEFGVDCIECVVLKMATRVRVRNPPRHFIILTQFHGKLVYPEVKDLFSSVGNFRLEVFMLAITKRFFTATLLSFLISLTCSLVVFFSVNQILNFILSLSTSC